MATINDRSKTNKRWVNHYLEPLNPCTQALMFANQFDDPQQAWDAADNAYYLCWVLRRVYADPKTLSRCMLNLIADVFPIWEHNPPCGISLVPTFTDISEVFITQKFLPQMEVLLQRSRSVIDKIEQHWYRRRNRIFVHGLDDAREHVFRVIRRLVLTCNRNTLDQMDIMGTIETCRSASLNYAHYLQGYAKLSPDSRLAVHQQQADAIRRAIPNPPLHLRRHCYCS